MRRILLFILIIFTFIQTKAQQNSNQLVFDTLVVYKHYGVILMVDIVNDDTTFIGDNIRSNEGFISDICAQAYKAEYNIASQLGSYVHGIKVELTRTADIQPSTGCWFGGQFVLNAGSSGYTDLAKPAYVLQAVFKGSDVSPNGNDFHVGRFETQSSADVSDIVYITANSGTTIQGHLLYLADHTGANGQLINVQSSQTMAKGLSFMAGTGATMTSLLYASGSGTFTNFLEVAATGDGGVTTSGMTNDDPNDIDEDGYILIKIGAQTAKVPFWYDD